MKLCVFGGTGATGVHAIQVAKDKGFDVVALARRPEVLRSRFSGIQVVPGDVFKPETIWTAIADTDAVISTLGPVGRARETTIHSEGVVNIAEAMEEIGKRRLVVAASLVGIDPQPDVTWYTLVFGKLSLIAILGYQYRDTTKMQEKLAKCNDLDWTMAGRPRLTNGKARGRCRSWIGTPLHPPSRISRADLAGCLVSIINDTATYQQWTEVSW